VLDGLKKLFSRKPRGVEVEYQQSSDDDPPVVPIGPLTSGVTPVVPVKPPTDEPEQR
jgi:hypothetical protein